MARKKPEPKKDAEESSDELDRGAVIDRLNDLASKAPWALFGIRELALMIRVNYHVISAVAQHPEGPFRGKHKKSRPERVAAFLLDPPANFVIDHGAPE